MPAQDAGLVLGLGNMAILGAASSAVISAFETCGLSPMSAHGEGRAYDPYKGRAAWLEGSRRLGSSAEQPAALTSSPSGSPKEASLGRSPASSAGGGGAFPIHSGEASPSAWEQALPPPPPPPPPRNSGKASSASAARDPQAQEREARRAKVLARLEELVEELFRLHDLNHNGVLEEVELIKLNEKIAMLHYGRDTDKKAVRDKFSGLFRSELDAEGKPVEYATFRGYMFKLLDGLDRNKQAQELIMEQFVEEAKSGRLAFHCQSFQSITDEPFRKMIEMHHR